MKIKFYLAARKQLEDIHDFIARDSKANAAKVYNGILDEIERLAAFPQIARTEDALGGLGYEFRSLVVLRHYKVVFFTLNEVVYIVSVWDCRRNPEDFLRIVKEIIG